MKRLASCLFALMSMGALTVHAEVFEYTGEFTPLSVKGKGCTSIDMAPGRVVAYLDIEQGRLKQGLIAPKGPQSHYFAIRVINELEWRLDMPYPDTPAALNHQLTLSAALGQAGAPIEAEFIPQPDARQSCQSVSERLSLKLKARGPAAAAAFALAQSGHEAALEAGKLFAQLGKATPEVAFGLNQRRLDFQTKAFGTEHINIVYTLQRLGYTAGRVPARLAEAPGYWRRAGELAESIAPDLAGKIWLDAARAMDGVNLDEQRRYFDAAARQKGAAAAWPTRTADLTTAALKLATQLEKQADKLEDTRKLTQSADLLWEAAGLVLQWAPEQPLERIRLIRLSARTLSYEEKLTPEQRALALSRAALAVTLSEQQAATQANTNTRSALARALNMQGIAFDNFELRTEAQAAYRKAIAAFGPAQTPDQHQALAHYHGNLAGSLEASKRYAESVKARILSLAALRDAGSEKSSAYVDGLWRLADSYRENEHTVVEEIDARKQAVALMSILPGYDAFAEDPLFKRVRLAERLHLAGRLQEASQVLGPLIEDLRSAAESHPTERRQAYELARGLTILAKLQRDSSAHVKALASLNEAVAILDRIDGRMARNHLWIYEMQAEALVTAGTPAPGIAILQETLALKMKDAQTPKEIVLQSRIRIAQLLPALQRWQDAERQLLEVRAEALRDFPAGHEIRARAYSALSAIYDRHTPARLDEALSFQQQSCKERELTQPPNADAMSTCLLILAGRYTWLDRLGDTKRSVERAASLISLERKDPLKGSASTLSFLGLTYYNLGRWNDARLAYEDALAIKRSLMGPDHLQLARNWTELGQNESSAGRPVPAISHFEEALRIRRLSLGEEQAMTIELAAHLATALDNAGRKSEALALAGKALELAKRSNASRNDQAMASYTYGNMLRGNKRPAEAIVLMHRTLSLLDSSSRLTNRIKSYDVLSQAYWDNKQPEAAILFGKLALNGSQKLRQSASDLEKSDQDSLREMHATAYRRIAGWMIDGGRLAEAQQVLTMLKDQEYSDFTRGSEKAKPGAAQAGLTPAESPWASRYQDIQSQLGRISFEIGNLQRKRDSGATISPADIAQWQTLIKDQEVASRAFDAALLDMGKAFTDQQARRAATDRVEADGALQETLAHLSGDTRQVALVHYLVGADQTRILVTTPDLRIARVSKVGQVEINRLVAAFRQALQNPSSDPQPLARQLYQALIQPIEGDLQGAHSSMLMLSLDGTLRYLPFAALHDGKQYLIERYGLSMDTAAARDRLRETTTAAPRVWAMGLTRAMPGFSALAGVQRELDGIVGSDGSRGKAMLDEAFTEQALQLGLQQRYPVLHIASHFKFMPGNEESSFLLLGDGSHLTLDDIRHRVRFQGTDLLTLSACETGVGGGDDANGREVEGLGALAQKRGARAVLATLWPVADSSTAQLMQNMYATRGAQKLSKAEALRQAQLGLLRGTVTPASVPKAADVTDKIAPPSGNDADRGARAHGSEPDNKADIKAGGKARATGWTHPYYWAPFILMGNWL